MPETIDYSQDVATPDDSELAQVSTLAEQQVVLEERIKKGEDLLAQLTLELREIREKKLPAAMQELGIDSFTLKSGRKISIKTEYFASLTDERKPAAFAWLREQGHGAIIKNIISAEFGKGEDAKALEAAALLAENGFKPEQKESVHAQTLKAFIKEQVTKGKDIPLETFGAFVLTKSKVD